MVMKMKKNEAIEKLVEKFDVNREEVEEEWKKIHRQQGWSDRQATRYRFMALKQYYAGKEMEKKEPEEPEDDHIEATIAPTEHEDITKIARDGSMARIVVVLLNSDGSVAFDDIVEMTTMARGTIINDLKALETMDVGVSVIRERGGAITGAVCSW